MSSWTANGGNNDGCFGFCSEKPAVPSVAQRTVKPDNHPIVKEVDTLIAKELFQMSLDEREKALDDVHGIVRSEEEDPNFLNHLLMQLEHHLCSMKQGTVYEEAEQLSEMFVRDPHFRTMFLRAEHFDPRHAAQRMLRFFECKKELFGRDKLVTKITLQDLDDDDMEALRSGDGQISPLKDASGRPIITFVQNLRKYKRIENVKRATFYMYMTAMESTEAQRKGIVVVFYNLNAPHATSVNSGLRAALPMNFGSLHLCVNEISTYVTSCAAVCTLSTKHRVRYRVHFGSHVEVMYELISFGIPRAAIPVDGNGVPYAHEHLEWVERRLEMENDIRNAPMRAQTILQHARICPSPGPPSMSSPSTTSMESSTSGGASDFEIHPHDVLFGRGKYVVDHPGNMKFRRLVDVYMHKYEEAERLEKTCIAEAIVQMIQESKGRFLKKEAGSDWEEVDGPAARKKVAHAFRNRRKLHGYGINRKSGPTNPHIEYFYGME